MPLAPDIERTLERELAGRVPGWPAAAICVALSGGVDSVALLFACHRIRSAQPGLRLRALHVHHGLQPAADQWLAQCRALCARLGLPFDAVQLELAPAAGESVEAAARVARYRALRERLKPGEALLTAHHQDDQLETVLLQLFRGAGIAGLAAMPAGAPFGPGLLLRPLLGVTRAAIEDYARTQGLEGVEDPGNASARFDRSLLRREITPRLRARWPAVARAVSRSARHAAAAQELLDQLAEMDADGALEPGRLQAARLAALPRLRQANLLRWWLRQNALGLPSEARLGAILDDLLPARADALPVVTWPSGEVRRFRGWLHAMPPLRAAEPGPWSLAPGERLEMAGAGTLQLTPAIGRGLSAGRFPGPFEVRLRRGGERLQPQGSPVEKSVTRLLREAGVPPWLRDRVPLLSSGGRLLAVGDRWIASGAAAEATEPGYAVVWSAGAGVG